MYYIFYIETIMWVNMSFGQSSKPPKYDHIYIFVHNYHILWGRVRGPAQPLLKCFRCIKL